MGNFAWRLDHKYGAAYLEDRNLVLEILGLAGKRSKLDDAVMATYLSPKGKPIAWQVKFETRNWERLSGKLGLRSYEKLPTPTEDERSGKPKKVTPRAAPRCVRKKRT